MWLKPVTYVDKELMEAKGSELVDLWVGTSDRARKRRKKEMKETVKTKPMASKWCFYCERVWILKIVCSSEWEILSYCLSKWKNDGKIVRVVVWCDKCGQVWMVK